MPIQFGKFTKSVEEIQDEKDNAEQFDAAADEAVTQIAEQNDGRLGARDMRSRRDDQRSHDQLFDMTEYFPGGLLDMLGVERKPPAFDILHDFSFCGRHRTDWPDRVAQTATFRKFQYNGSAIKKQEGGSPDLTRAGRMRESKCVRQNVAWPINKDTSGRTTCVHFCSSHPPSWPLPPR
jgi:hypothetical protein